MLLEVVLLEVLEWPMELARLDTPSPESLRCG